MMDETTQNGFDPKQLRPIRAKSKAGDLKPFHESLLPDGILRITEFERSFSTKLGTTFEECARIIAQSVHKNATRGYHVKGIVTDRAIKRIEEITNTIGNGGMKSEYPKLVEEIIEMSKDGAKFERANIADLYIETNNGKEWYFEIKSPKPNKGQCLEATGRLLQIQAIRQAKYPNVKTFYATAYNPYGVEKSMYMHSFAINYMDLANEVLIGKEFWDMIGGNGTYEEVLSIYQDVGTSKKAPIYLINWRWVTKL